MRRSSDSTTSFGQRSVLNAVELPYFWLAENNMKRISLSLVSFARALDLTITCTAANKCKHAPICERESTVGFSSYFFLLGTLGKKRNKLDLIFTMLALQTLKATEKTIALKLCFELKFINRRPTTLLLKIIWFLNNKTTFTTGMYYVIWCRLVSILTNQ